jgi:hypothetical protein
LFIGCFGGGLVPVKLFGGGRSTIFPPN